MGYRAGGNPPQQPQATDNWSQAQHWRGGHRGKGPVGYTRSDERIREAACEALTDDDQVDATDMEIVVHDGEVTLSGIADDRHAKRLAEDCVWRVTGVRDVQNQLRLRPQGNPPRNGEVSTTKHRA